MPRSGPLTSTAGWDHAFPYLFQIQSIRLLRGLMVKSTEAWLSSKRSSNIANSPPRTVVVCFGLEARSDRLERRRANSTSADIHPRIDKGR